jgi:hypothetical protein
MDLGSARDSRAGDGDLAIADFLLRVNGGIVSLNLSGRGDEKSVAASRRHQHAGRVRSPNVYSLLAIELVSRRAPR